MTSRQLAGCGVYGEDMRCMQLISGAALLLVVIYSSEWAEANEIGERSLIF